MTMQHQVGVLKGTLRALMPDGDEARVYADHRTVTAWCWFVDGRLLKATIATTALDELGCDAAARYLARELAVG